MNLLAFGTPKITDEIAKKFQPIYDSITEFFGRKRGREGERQVS